MMMFGVYVFIVLYFCHCFKGSLSAVYQTQFAMELCIMLPAASYILSCPSVLIAVEDPFKWMVSAIYLVFYYYTHDIYPTMKLPTFTLLESCSLWLSGRWLSSILQRAVKEKIL